MGWMENYKSQLANYFHSMLPAEAVFDVTYSHWSLVITSIESFVNLTSS